MSGITFTETLGRPRLDRLEHEIAVLADSHLRIYRNDDSQVHDAFREAGRHFYCKEFSTYTTFSENVVIPEADRLLKLCRTEDGLWSRERDEVAIEIGDPSEKIFADVDQIRDEIIAEVGDFEREGYHHLEIGRALVRIGYLFAPLGFVMRDWNSFQKLLPKWKAMDKEFLRQLEEKYGEFPLVTKC